MLKHNTMYVISILEHKVNQHVHAKLITNKPPIKSRVTINKIAYWKGLELICKEHFKEKGKKLYVNYSYNLTSISQHFFTVQDIIEGTTMTLHYRRTNYKNILAYLMLTLATVSKASLLTIL